jgi:DNA-binding response OmpR family regulator/two-component sensor histidine kinase
MAHDIRSSLTLIKGPLYELDNESTLSEIGRVYLQLAKNQAIKLSAVVTQLMDFQKADIHKETMSFSQTDIVEFVANRVLMFETVAKIGGNTLSFTPNLPHYLSAIDESKMEKIVDNLLSNAIKYSPKSSTVAISLTCEPKQWKLSVHDLGIGISKKAQRQLFKEFYRGENAVNSKVVGSGIGLLLVKSYVNLHKGQVQFRSVENEGSTFEITIPFQEYQPSLQKGRTLPTNIAKLNEQPMVIWPESQTDAKKTNVRSGMQVLIVEDNTDLLRFLESALKREFQIMVAENGKQAWDLIQTHQPDLVVSDIMMPEMDGSELCRSMKSSDETAHIPIILLTALSEKTDILHGLGLGADAYLTKPFDMSLLIQRIKTIVKNRDLVRYRALKMIKGDSTEPLLLNNLNDKFMKKLFDVVRANMSNAEFDKEQFASAMNVSSSLLYKKMKSLTNLSPSDFVKIVRLEHSLELLHARTYTVTEVSELCGFSSMSYFSTVFKKHFGKSPTDIIK